MVARTVVWTETAAKQRREILKFWVKNNGNDKFAKKLISIIKVRLKHVCKKPELFKSADFPDTRVAAMGNFSLFYKITEENIIVTGFWDNRQDPQKLLELLSK